MNTTERLEDFRAALEVALSGTQEFTVKVEDARRFLWIITTHKLPDGKLGAQCVINTHRPDLRKPIPYDMVTNAVDRIIAEFASQSTRPAYTEEARNEAARAHAALTNE